VDRAISNPKFVTNGGRKCGVIDLSKNVFVIEIIIFEDGNADNLPAL
jgi:hypothetical protein